jgi:phosphopantothenoylcysteine synthetase/decarboxylase
MPTPRIIDSIKRVDDSVVLVGFKFVPRASRYQITNDAQHLIKRSGADLVVANTMSHGDYRAYLVSPEKISGAIHSREKLIKALIQEMGRMECRN